MKSNKRKKVFGITILLILTILFPVFEAQFTEGLIEPEEHMNTRSFTHTVLGELGTATWCGYCPGASAQMHQVYNLGHPFHYVSLVADKNSHASSRCSELGISGYPTAAFDGGYIKIVGLQSNYSAYENAVLDCGERTVANIDLNMNAFWMGGGELYVNVDVTNNGASDYNGHLHVYVTEMTSRWNDAGGTPYKFAMINNYAINQNIQVSSGSTKTYSNLWSGYTDISFSNIKLIASVFSQSTMHTDETTAGYPQYPNSDPPSTPNQPAGPSSGFIGIEYTFSTSATEPNGDQIQYGWDWNGDGTVDYWTDFYSSGQTVEASNSWDSVGTYNVKVKAKDQFGDESGWSTANQIQIGIGDPPNIPLTPSGPDNGNHKTVYSFSTSTTDPNPGDKLFYKFDWDDGTTSQWLGPYESGETMSTDYAWNEPGTFHIRVKAKDLAGSESDWSDTKTVIMENTPPSKPLKPSGPTYGIVGTRYIFSTSATDAENDQLEYLFSWGDGTDSGWTPFNYAEHAWFEPGDFQVRVKARDTWDESEWSNPSTLSIEAGSLTVTINVEPNSAIIHEEIQFSAIVSDGTEPYTYNWDFGDGNKSNEQNLIYSYEQPGDYFVSLSVEDNAGAYGSNFITITINITNPPEKPAIIDGPESAVIKQPSDFTFSSVDPNGDDVYIFVDWGDESNGTWEGPFESGEELVLSHAWEYEGVYTIRAKAKDTYDFGSDWSQPFEITIGWQNAFIIGTINNKIETNNQFEFSADFLIYVGSDPFKIGIYKSGEHFVVSDDYRGIFGNNFILGKFEVGYIQG